MYTVKGKLEVLNANAVHVLQPCLSKLSPAFVKMQSVGNWRSLHVSSHCTKPKLLRFAHQALNIFSTQLGVD